MTNYRLRTLTGKTVREISTMSKPTLCPVCGCPIQRLCENHEPVGTIQQALDRHADVVHPETRPEL